MSFEQHVVLVHDDEQKEGGPLEVAAKGRVDDNRDFLAMVH